MREMSLALFIIIMGSNTLTYFWEKQHDKDIEAIKVQLAEQDEIMQHKLNQI